MKNKNVLDLIDGKFSPSDAKELLVNLFSSKIQFHQMKNFSSKERFGKDDKLAIKKIPMLTENMETILQILKKAAAQKTKVVIKSVVEISYIKDKKINNT